MTSSYIRARLRPAVRSYARSAARLTLLPVLQLLVTVPCALAGDALPRLGGAGLSVVIDEDVKLTASERKPFYRFGQGVALAGDTALVGAPGPSGSVLDTPGEAYVYVRSDGVWSEQARLTASDSTDEDFFGVTVALSDDGDTALVGAVKLAVGTEPEPGVVYVFTHDDGVWSEQAKLVASDGADNDLFGAALAISGDTALVGAPGAVVDGLPFRGAAYAFTRSDGVWSEQQKVIAADGGPAEAFGIAVALEGDTALMGAPFAFVDGNPQQGAAYVFTRDAGVWSEQVKLTASDGAVGDAFGLPAALAGETALFGAGGATIDGNASQGAAYVFTHDAGQWSEQAKLVAADGVADDGFGSASASLEGDIALISAPPAAENRGAAYVFLRSDGVWDEHEKLLVSDGQADDRFGSSVALSGTTGLIGAPSVDAVDPDPDPRGQGAAYVFKLFDLAIRPDPLDFGPVRISQTRGPLPVTVANTSLDEVTVSEISAPSAPFAADAGTCDTPPFTLVPGESCELSYRFSPSTLGAAAATVTLTSDAPTDLLTLELQGIGVDATLVFSPEELDVGDAGVPFNSRPPRSVTLTNADATSALEVDSVSAPGEPFVAFGGSCGEPPFILESFASCTLDYYIHPQEVGVYSSEIEVTSDAPGSPHSFTLEGEGLLWELTISPQTLDFGAVPVGETSKTLDVTLSNTGGFDVVLLDVSAPGTPFTLVEDACGVLLEPGESCTFGYAFAPSAAGEATAEVVIDSDAPSGEQTVFLQGTGTAAALDVEPDSLAVALETGQSETRPLQLANLGNLPLEWAVTEEIELAGRVLLPAGTTSHPATVPPAGPVDGLTRLAGSPVAETVSHPFPAPGAGTTTITHSASLDIQGSNTAACINSSDGTSVENQFLRVFTLPEFGILGAFDVVEVTFGIAELTTATPIVVNLYTLDGGKLTYDNLTLIGTATEDLAAQDLTLVTVPVIGTAPPGSTLVVEIDVPDLSGVGGYFPGANDVGETAPSYLAADDCGLPDPTPMADVEFPDLHLVMTVTGIAEEIDCALPTWAAAAPLNGTVAAGESQTVAVTFDTGDLAPGVFDAHLCLASNDPTWPTAVVPLTLTVGEGAALVLEPTSLVFGEVPVGTTSTPQTASLSNTGDLAAEGLAFDPPGGDFAVDASACGDTLPGGQTCEVSVTFAPAVAGPAADSLVVSGTGGLSATLDLAGTGIEDGGLTPMALAVDPDERVSDGNGVFEPGELVTVAPWWRNDGALPKTLMGSASDFVGPGGVPHTVEQENASYGTLDPGQTAGCLDTGACYSMVVADPAARPSIHWEATFEETLDDADGTAKTWTLHIGDSFTDVPPTHLFYVSIETLLHAGVTGGCVEDRYCPDGVNARSQMPVFVLRAFEGANYTPEACVEGDERFDDVPFDNPFCPWIEELAARGIVSGCGDGNYCPSAAVTRAQMAIFLLKTLEGADYTPIECTAKFDDVPCTSLFADWIEDLAAREITGGCSETGYCPADPVSRAQMAVFVTRAFGLRLYGP